MYKSKMEEAESRVDAHTRAHTIQVLRELISNPQIPEDDRDMYVRCLSRFDRCAPTVAEHHLIVGFRKRNLYLN